LLIEHVLYSLAFAVLVGMMYDFYTTRNPAWIVVFAVLLPDTDMVFRTVWEVIFPTKIPFIQHGSFHNVLALCVFTVVIGWLVNKYLPTVDRNDAMVCVFLGFLAHLVEDAFVYTEPFPFFFPFSDMFWNTGVLIATDDIHWGLTPLASTNVLLFGILVLAAAILIRIIIQGRCWIELHINSTAPLFTGGYEYLHARIISPIQTGEIIKSFTIMGISLREHSDDEE